MVVTIKDVAREAGVSPATVSRVLSKQTNFYGPKTELKVRQAVEKLGYQKNMLAENLVKKGNNVIAVVISSVKTNFSDQIIHGINYQARLNNNDVIYAYASSIGDEEQERVLRMMVSRRVSGIILVSVLCYVKREKS